MRASNGVRRGTLVGARGLRALGVVVLLALPSGCQNRSPASERTTRAESGEAVSAAGVRLVYAFDREADARSARTRHMCALRRMLAELLHDEIGWDTTRQLGPVELAALEQRVRVQAREGSDTFEVRFGDGAVAARVLEPLRARLPAALVIEPQPATPGNPDPSSAPAWSVHPKAARTDPSLDLAAAEQTLTARLARAGLKDVLVGTVDAGLGVVVYRPDEGRLTLVKSLCQSMGRLEFKRVDDDTDFFARYREGYLADLPAGLSFALQNQPTGPGRSAVVTDATLQKQNDESLPDTQKRMQRWLATLAVDADHELALLPWTQNDSGDGRPAVAGYRAVYLWRTAELDGTHVRDAVAATTDYALPGADVSLVFDASGGEIFARLTGDNVKRRFAIVVDGWVESTPVIQERISGGKARISMGAGSVSEQLEQARSLAAVLTAGALPAPLQLAREERVGG